MTPVEAAAVAAIRAHAGKHRTSGRAVFSVAGIELLLRLFDEEQAQVFAALQERDDLALMARAEKAEYELARWKDVDAKRPITPLLPDDGRPAWKQVVDLFLSNGRAAPDWRLRDEIVNLLVWARYGEKAAAALSRLSTELVEEKAQVFAALQERDDLAVALAEKAARQ